jgi:hypothetical protein
VVDSLKTLDPNRPIREADILSVAGFVLEQIPVNPSRSQRERRSLRIELA